MGGTIKMSWFKFAKDFSDRNVINAKIRYLKEIRENIEYNSKVIFQSGTTVKNSNYSIITSSKISSYPALHDLLIQADSIALDSPWRFGELCAEAIGKIDQLVYGLKKEREDITYEGKKDKPKKGWV
jgi:hypothetical protein